MPLLSDSSDNIVKSRFGYLTLHQSLHGSIDKISCDSYRIIYNKESICVFPTFESLY